MQIATLLTVDGFPVFYSPGLENDRTRIFNSLADGTATGVDCFGEPMEPQDAMEDFIRMVDFYRPRNRLERIYRNILLAPSVISIVREEILRVEADLDPLAYFSKLEQVVQLTGLGLFCTAAGVLAALNRDEFLTDERLARWALMLNTANAI